MLIFRKIFYTHFVNFIIRNLLFPFRSILPEKFKIPVNGTIKVHVGEKPILFTANETSHMFRELFWNHSKCDFEFSTIFSELILKSKVFFDVGANIGYYSILAKRINPDATVVAFEPSNGPFYFLKKNIKLNHFNDIIVNKLAVGNYKGFIDFFEDVNPKFPYLKYNVGGAGNTANTWHFKDSPKYEVEITTLDYYIFSNQIPTVDILKIDTEATEDKVLIGCVESIKKFQPIIICEVLYNAIEDKIFEIIKELEYEMYQHNEELNTLILVDKLDSSKFRNYFFIPKCKDDWIRKFVV